MNKLTKKQIDILQIVCGIVMGVLTWLALQVSSRTSDGLLRYLWLVALVLVIFVPRNIESKINMKLSKFRIAFIIVFGVGLVITAILFLTNPSSTQ